MPRAARSKQTARVDPLKGTSGHAGKKKSNARSTSKPVTEDVAPTAENTPSTSIEGAIDKLIAATNTLTSAIAPAPTSTTNVTCEASGTLAGIEGSVPVAQRNIQPGETQAGPKTSPNYLLLTHLLGTEEPTITRLLSVPRDFNFAEMHEVMQAAFGWAGCHMWHFRVEEARSRDEEDEQPFIYPQVHFYLDNKQFDMGSEDEHHDAAEWTLADLFENEKYAGKTSIVYEYDFGDSWEHDITLVGYEAHGTRRAMGIPEDVKVACLAGEGHPCAEDCGSTEGWENLKEVFAKARTRDAEDKELKEWYKSICSNGDPKGLNPYTWDILNVNDALDLIRAPLDAP